MRPSAATRSRACARWSGCGAWPRSDKSAPRGTTRSSRRCVSGVCSCMCQPAAHTDPYPPMPSLTQRPILPCHPAHTAHAIQRSVHTEESTTLPRHPAHSALPSHAIQCPAHADAAAAPHVPLPQVRAHDRQGLWQVARLLRHADMDGDRARRPLRLAPLRRRLVQLPPGHPLVRTQRSNSAIELTTFGWPYSCPLLTVRVRSLVEQPA
jgi:hypothetical protein